MKHGGIAVHATAMETDAPCYAWRTTSGAEPGAVKAASPVLNGEDEETGRKALRLVLTQPGSWRRLTPGVRRLRRGKNHYIVQLR